MRPAYLLRGVGALALVVGATFLLAFAVIILLIGDPLWPVLLAIALALFAAAWKLLPPGLGRLAWSIVGACFLVGVLVGVAFAIWLLAASLSH